jgi:hypothetical protein
MYVLKNWPLKNVAKTLGIGIGRVFLATHRVSKLVKKGTQLLQSTGSTKQSKFNCALFQRCPHSGWVTTGCRFRFVEYTVASDFQIQRFRIRGDVRQANYLRSSVFVTNNT